MQVLPASVVRFVRIPFVLLLTLCAMGSWAVTAEAKAPGATHCFNGTCHRVKTLAEMEQLVDKDVVQHTSFYDSPEKDRFNPSIWTSSGERFRPDEPNNAASPIYPDGTQLMVWNPTNGRALVVRINNAGPYYGKRTLDLSRAAAERLGFLKSGVVRLHTRVIYVPTVAEARYRRNRTYTPVRGYIGEFASAEQAMASLQGSARDSQIVHAKTQSAVRLASLDRPPMGGAVIRAVLKELCGGMAKPAKLGKATGVAQMASCPVSRGAKAVVQPLPARDTSASTVPWTRALPTPMCSPQWSMEAGEEPVRCIARPTRA